ncbi:DedA family protein [Deinococcus maricopensis]|uniref:SNARE associated Golgi protein-like protein n=1 Tax=Deinococcus maricopensis (strain DSM 21211 / LMG 22137 / NRRL B-23946 / LB-34) TaxID=709986 RepID=E8U8V2_DEIML|nr:DedA family protein [Deinococcus maricopensis]ADV67491.1 SNARE associated Golgi protein-like protein [Deinococcus maricopensis DSM 21211]
MLDWIQHLMQSMGYIGIALLMCLENVFPPIPSELIMPLAGFTASRGDLTFVGVVIAGTVGSVLGALPLYYIGKVVGEERLVKWADKYGAWLTVSGDEIRKADDWFDRHGHKMVLFVRLVPGVRSLISIPAGISGMPLPKFLLYTSIGTALWSTLLASLGLLLGEHYERVEQYLGPATYLILGGLLLYIVVSVIRRRRRQK